MSLATSTDALFVDNTFGLTKKPKIAVPEFGVSLLSSDTHFACFYPIAEGITISKNASSAQPFRHSARESTKILTFIRSLAFHSRLRPPQFARRCCDCAVVHCKVRYIDLLIAVDAYTNFCLTSNPMGQVVHPTNGTSIDIMVSLNSQYHVYIL